MSTRNGASVLDHVVFNVRHDMDRQAALFTALGFQLTPRGHHTLGSINHLMVLDSDYLELVGLPEGSSARPELLSAPPGLNGLVFASADIEATHAHLQALGLAGEPPRDFSRPLEIDGQQVHARFRTVTVRTGQFPARVYFCEHATPQYIWRQAWRAHANQVVGTAACIMVHEAPAAEVQRYAALLQRPVLVESEQVARVDLGTACLEVLAPAALHERFGELPEGPMAAGFAALSLRTADLRATLACLRTAGLAPLRSDATRIVLHLPGLDALLEFVA